MQSKEMSRSCPGCGKNVSKKLASMTARQIIESSPYYDSDAYSRLCVAPESIFPIVRCKKCNLVYAGGLPSDTFLNQLYNSGENEDIYSSVAIFSRPERLSQQLHVFSSLLKIIDQKVLLDKRNVPVKPIRILDYGCSFGAGLLSLCRPGYPYELTGVEINKSARSYLKGQSAEVFQELSDVDENLRFNGIVLNDVLEHVSDPLDVLKHLYTYADKKAVLYINVPDFSEWRLQSIIDQIKSGKNVEKDMNPWEHLTYFSPITLNMLAADAGWKRVEPSIYSYSFSKSGRMKEKTLGLLRVLRDWCRFQRGVFPANYSTSSFFVRE